MSMVLRGTDFITSQSTIMVSPDGERTILNYRGTDMKKYETNLNLN